MKYISWTRYLLLLAMGAVAFQTAACSEPAVWLVTISSVVTASGVVYLVWRIVD